VPAIYVLVARRHVAESAIEAGRAAAKIGEAMPEAV
jgi:predicted transcriptional regulator